MSVEIVSVKERMLGDIEAIEKLCFDPPWTVEQLRSQMSGHHIFLAAVENGTVLGYVGLEHVLDEGYISNIAVAPEARRRGIADMLLDELGSRARGLGLSFVTLEVRDSNHPARALYEKHGFSVVGRRKNYYTRPKEDAVLMTLITQEA